jgi:hypothetical protein
MEYDLINLKSYLIFKIIIDYKYNLIKIKVLNDI